MCDFITNHISGGLNANILQLKNNDAFFEAQTNVQLKNLYAYADSILGYLMECSHHVSEAFGAVWKKYLDNPVINPQLQDLFSGLDGVISKIQGTVDNHWKYKPADGVEKYALLKTSAYRNTLLNYFYDISKYDKTTLELIQQAAGLIKNDYFDLSV